MEPLYLEVFAEFPQVKGFFATKNGASEGSPYYHEETIRRQGLETMNFVWPGQVHKDHIEVIEKRREEPQRFPDTDGVITNVPEVLLTTVHADCLPVYFFDPEKKAIGLVHAGWRGRGKWQTCFPADRKISEPLSDRGSAAAALKPDRK